MSPFDSIGLAGLQVYGTYAEGFRAPSLSETLITGLHPNGVVFPFLPNPYLRPETAKTWEFGLNYSKDGIFQADDNLRVKAAYFNNDIDDYIAFFIVVFILIAIFIFVFALIVLLAAQLTGGIMLGLVSGALFGAARQATALLPLINHFDPGRTMRLLETLRPAARRLNAALIVAGGLLLVLVSR